MKKIVALLAISSFLFADDFKETRSSMIQTLERASANLYSQLNKKLESDKSGVSAFKFCAENAQSIIRESSNKYLLKRATLNTRTPQAIPNDIDKEAIDDFKKAFKEKKDVTAISKDNADFIKVYLPIKAETTCLKCHGTNVSKEIAKLIKEHYPNDHSINFKEGDFMGVFVAEYYYKK